jgi:hypothetical protein
MMKANLILAGAILALATPAQAKTTSANDPDKIVCKREKRSNSRFTQQTCHTRAQWLAIAEEQKRAYAEQRDRPVIDITRDN